MIFIDYYLGREVGSDPDTGQNKAVKRAEEKAKEIYALYKDKQLPLIILMSSRPNVEDHKDEFLDDTGILGGMFYFIPKEDLATKDKLFLKLGTLINSLETGYKIQYFVDSIDNSIKAVSVDFIKHIKRLSLEDYSYIQKLSLQEDGHPLGDYMLWLYSSYFGHLLFEKAPEVSKHRGIIDGVTFDSLLPCHVPPSHQLATIYKSALFDNSVGELKPHPRTPTEETGDPNKLDFHLGDLFVKKTEKNVLMIINAQCDLAFAPDGKRSPSVDFLLFIHGALVLLDEKADGKNPRTELFEYNGSSYKIIWDIKKVTTQLRNSAKKWLENETFERIGRLRLPFSLEVQQAFSSNLTRGGMPAPPPIYQFIKIRLSTDNGTSFSDLKDSAFLLFSKEKVKCRFTVDFVLYLKDELRKAVTKIQADIITTSKQKDKKKLEDKKRKYDDFLMNDSEWAKLYNDYHDLPSNVNGTRINSVIRIFRNAEKCNGNEPLLINVLDI